MNYESLGARCLTLRDLRLIESKPEEDRTVWILLRGVVDENGERAYSDEDSDRILDMPLPTVKRLTTDIVDLSGLGDDDPEKKG